MKLEQENISLRNLASRVLGSKDAAEAFLESHVRNYISRQIRALRKDRGWSQERLAEEAKSEQPNISRAENLKYGNFTINTLVQIAKAFDLGLSVQFVPFSEMLGREYRPEYLAPARAEDRRLSAFAAGTENLGPKEVRVKPPPGKLIEPRGLDMRGEARFSAETSAEATRVQAGAEESELKLAG